MKTEDRSLINEAIDLLKSSKSIDYARSLAKKLVDEAWEDAKPILPQSTAKAYIKALSYFFVDRKI